MIPPIHRSDIDLTTIQQSPHNTGRSSLLLVMHRVYIHTEEVPNAVSTSRSFIFFQIIGISSEAAQHSSVSTRRTWMWSHQACRHWIRRRRHSEHCSGADPGKRSPVTRRRLDIWRFATSPRRWRSSEDEKWCSLQGLRRIADLLYRMGDSWSSACTPVAPL